MSIRTEKDSMGSLDVPKDALYGPQTQRAVNNFPVSGRTMPAAFVRALLLAKRSAAEANYALELMPKDMSEAIVSSVDDLLLDDRFMINFPVDIYQTGSGTSSNMNANEVLATLASRRLGREVSANDHVNFAQSSNDIIPTAIHISASMQLQSGLLPALYYLAIAIERKAQLVHQHVKTGRTHLMDAMPVRMSQSLMSWATQIRQNIDFLEGILPSVRSLAQGGTAVGTGVNAHSEFPEIFCKKLSKKTGICFTVAKNFFTHIGTQDIAVALSGNLKTVAVSIMKISNDLRWMNSGPLAGLGEIVLEPLQPGSSIMPGKVNPVIPESSAMVAAQVMGNDVAISIGGQSGSFELNVMMPMIADNLLRSIEMLTNVSRLLADKAISTFKVNEEQLNASLSRNPILVTALNPVIGYAKAAEIAKKAYAQSRPVIEVAIEETEMNREALETLLDPMSLTRGGLGNT